jgi:hypothetical protein
MFTNSSAGNFWVFFHKYRVPWKESPLNQEKNSPPLWKPKVHYRVHNSPPLAPILSHMYPVQALPHYFIKIHSNIILASMTYLPDGLFPSGFQTNFISTSHLFHARYMPRPAHSPWLDHPNILGRVQITKLLIVSFSPPSCSLTRTNPMKQSPSWEADNRSAGQEFPLLMEPEGSLPWSYNPSGFSPERLESSPKLRTIFL